MMLYAHVKR